MASKYQKLRNSLPAFEQESTFQSKVDNWKAQIGDNAEHVNISFLAAEFKRFREQKEEHEAAISDLNVALEALGQTIVEKMQDDEIEKVGLSDGSTCYMNYEVYPSVKDKAALLAWAKKHKIELSVQWQTLKGICGELTTEGKPLPPGVQCFLKVSARIRNNGNAG
jgi:hypothetical protein